MNKIFLVTSGEYSDYSIHGVFSTEENAKAYIEFFNLKDNGADIEEWELNPCSEQIRDGFKPYSLRINKNGEIKDLRDSRGDFWFRAGDVGFSFTYDKEWMNVNCLAKDKDHAVKIAGDRRSAILREGWPEKSCNPY